MEKQYIAIAFVVDKHRLTIYMQDGTSEIVNQGDPRIQPLVEKLQPALRSGPTCLLTEEDFAGSGHHTEYAEAEKATGGVVKFFRTMKSKVVEAVKRFIDPVPEMSVQGQQEVEEAAKAEATPIINPENPLKPVEVNEHAKECNNALPITNSAEAIAEIMAHAIPATSRDFGKTKIKDNETIVAVLEDGTLIPGMEKLSVQMQSVVAKLGNPVGVQNFFRRLASVKRNHSVEDLLTFMQKGELPIADDGSVLVYKRLQSTSEEGVFVDCHSGRVKQRVGTKVFMAEHLVDPSRSRDCSNGLHVARRDYLGSFSGNVTVLAKLAPEDVIAVPHSDARKLRAMAYHIIARLSAEDASLVCRNKPMTDTTLLGNAIAGNHVGVLYTTEITEAYGGGCIYTDLNQPEGVIKVELDESLQGKSLDELPLVEGKLGTNVDAVALALAVEKAPAPKAKVAKPTQADKAGELYEEFTLANGNAKVEAAKKLLAFKKAAKKSWAVLGLSDAIADELQTAVHVGFQPEAAPAKPVRVVKAANGKTGSKPKKKSPAKPQTSDKEPVRQNLNNSDDAFKGKSLEDLYVMADDGDKDAAAELLKRKKAKKKGWEALGLPADTGVIVEMLLK